MKEEIIVRRIGRWAEFKEQKKTKAAMETGDTMPTRENSF